MTPFRIRRPLAALPALLAVAAACKKEAPPVVYQAVAVERRDIVVSAQASGRIVPDTIVEVKSRASGEVLEIGVESGQQVKRGQLLLRIDPRTPRNNVEQATAQLEVAQAQLSIAESQKKRSDELLKAQTITQQENESALLTFANAKAAVVSARVALENAKIALEDTDVRASGNGTVIEKAVERGQMIASATQNVGGGTVLLRMADLSLVQTITYVDETDIGKVKPGLEATVTVDAYPNKPFRGTVLKIEPNDTTIQNVTMYPVRIRIPNPDGLLLPGMNCDVEIAVGRREGVLAVPTSALRTRRDVASAAQVLGLDMASVEQQLARGAPAPQGPTAGGDTAGTRSVSLGATPPGGAAPSGPTMTTSDGRVMKLPPGVKEAQVNAIFAKFRSGEGPSEDDRKILNALRALNGDLRGGRGGAGGRGGREKAQGSTVGGGAYIVFAKRGPAPEAVNIRTGLTDLDYAEVVTGLAEGDSVMVLPSASLVQSQQEFKNRISQMTGGGMPAGMRQQGGGAGGQGGGARPATGGR
ncbi:MAG: efflux RND transporter periplasmic adaptor subunit [Gemmatimonadales bacterium]|nr:efflux RND transporter periplasmic adaptor subunit [Gemmatimonadales bacterium]